jgi:hypothetical protein
LIWVQDFQQNQSYCVVGLKDVQFQIQT